MRLVEDYLRAIALLLPRETRDDIVAELRDVVLTRLEAREAELGRPLVDDEIEAVLREVGHPLAVAARYRDEPQHVIGPVLYPFWLFAVKAAVALQAAVAGVVLLVRVLSGESVGRALGHALSSIAEGAITLIGIATLVAWLVERRKMPLPYLDRWRVRDLRLFDVAAWDWSSLEKWREPRSTRVGAVQSPRASNAARGLGQVAAGVVLLLWWVGALHIFGRDPGDLRAAGIDEGNLAGVDWDGLKTALFLPVILYAVALIVGGAASMVRPQLLRLEGALDVASGGALVALAWWLAYASPLAAHVQVASVAELVARVRAGFQDGPPFPLAVLINVALAFVGFAGVCRVVAGLWKLIAGRENLVISPATPQPSGT